MLPSSLKAPTAAASSAALMRNVQAFQSLDSDKKGYLEAEYFKNLMSRRALHPPNLLSRTLHLSIALNLVCFCSHGEKFSQEELEEMLAAAVDVETGRIYYEDFAELLADS